jgi:hypothetical protein
VTSAVGAINQKSIIAHDGIVNQDIPTKPNKAGTAFAHV